MATCGEKTEGNQTACELVDYMVKLEKARKITLFLNGDRNFFGAQMLVNKKHFRTWDGFLNASTEKTGVTSAVRYITTPVNGTKLGGLDDLEDKESYVAITRGQFKPIGYTGLSDRYKQYSSSNIHSTTSILKIRPVEHSRIQVPGKIGQIPIHAMMINVFLNGKDFDAPFRIALSEKVQKRWYLVMKEIGEHVNGILGRPKALYTVDGSKVITKSSDLEPGGEYVIVGNEPGGFMHYCYGCQARAKHPKKLPPIKKKRRRPKRIVEKEITTFDVAQPENIEAIASGDQEAQQSYKGFAQLATSQGDLPFDTTFRQPDDYPLDTELAIAKHSSITSKSGSQGEMTASRMIEKTSSSRMKVAEKTQSAPFNSADVTGAESVEYFQAAEMSNVMEQSYPLQATDMKEESEQELGEETEQELGEETEQELGEETEQELEEKEAGKIFEIEPEKEMGGEQHGPLSEQAVASSSTVDLVSDMQQSSEKDELNYLGNKTSDDSTTREFHADDPSAANSEVAAQSQREIDSGGQESTYVQSDTDGDKTLMVDKDEPAPADVFVDDKVQDGDKNEFLLDDKGTDADVKEEMKDRNEDSIPAAMDANDFSASEQNVQSVKGSDKTLTENKDEPAPLGDTNTATETALDTNDSDAPEQAKRKSSDTLVKAEFSKSSTVAKDPSEINTAQKSSSEADIQPHR